MTSNNFTLIIVVSGQPTTTRINPHQTVEHLVHEALQQSGNKGQPPADWELRRSDGGLIEQTMRIDDAGITDGMTLYLSPRAGAGGFV